MTWDNTQILADIAMYTGAALTLIAALKGAKWGLHATGLLRPRG